MSRRAMRLALEALERCTKFDQCDYDAMDALKDALNGDNEQIPSALFDGFAVYQMIDEHAKKRTSPENVADTLDAVVKLMRSPSRNFRKTIP